MSVAESRIASVLLAPIVSEKSSIAADVDKRFVFKVQKVATKKQIKSALN